MKAKQLKALKREVAGQEARTELARLRAAEVSFAGAYEAASTSPELTRERRQPQVEYTSEDGQLGSYERLRAVARGRNLHRNFGQLKAWERQFRLGVVGTGPKIRFHTKNEQFNEQAARFVNRLWAHECDGKFKPGLRGGRHLADLLALELAHVHREGDLICWFDAAGVVPGGEGRLHYFEADQLVEIEDWDAHKGEIAERLGIPGGEVQQAVGLLFDGWGRLHGFAVTPAYGRLSAKFKDVTVLPVENATLLSRPWRVGQARGIAEQIAVFDDLQDLREFRRAVLLRAKTQAGLALFFKNHNSAKVAAGRSTSTDTGAARKVTDADATALKNHTNLEKWARGAVAYGEVDEDVQSLSLSGDSQEFSGLSDAVGNAAGWSQGLSRLHSGGKADASYSAGMAEMGMDRRNFGDWQKWLERYSLDWKAYRVLDWAISTGRLPAQTDWTNWSWTDWPRVDGINPDREANARQTDLKNGITDYSELLGPDWKKHFDALAEQVAYAREKGVPLELLAATAAAPAGASPLPTDTPTEDTPNGE